MSEYDGSRFHVHMYYRASREEVFRRFGLPSAMATMGRGGT